VLREIDVELPKATLYEPSRTTGDVTEPGPRLRVRIEHDFQNSFRMIHVNSMLLKETIGMGYRYGSGIEAVLP
jgi:hypothetical protein